METIKSPGINKKKRAIYNSTIIAICASFETFLEVAVKDALTYLLSNAKSSSQIPGNVLNRVSKRLIDSKDDVSIWKISGDGWKDEVLKNYELLISKFNTPRPANIDEFLFQTIGLRNASKSWKWRGQSSTSCTDKLNDFMNLRGDIAHRRRPNRPVRGHYFQNYANFLFRISTIISNQIREKVHKQVGGYPWEHRVINDIL